MSGLGIVALLLVFLMASMMNAQDVVSQDLFVAGQDGYHTFRIPAIITSDDGDVLVFCEGRKNSRRDNGDIDLLLKRSTDGGETWSDSQVVWDDGPHTCGNPCPVLDRETGAIVLLSTWNNGADHEKKITAGTAKDTRRPFILISHDDGKTWSTARDLSDQAKLKEWGWYATGPGVGIQLRHGPHKGRLVIPSDHSSLKYPHPHYGSHVIYSDDHGATWKISDAVQPGVNECQVVELSNGTLMLDMRNHRKDDGYRAIAFSDDGGETWPRINFKSSRIEPQCQASMITLQKKAPCGKPVVLFSNPASQTDRIKMTVRASLDEGATWPIAKEIYPGATAYSCLIELPEGRIGCLYERGDKTPYERITLATFSYGWLEDGAD